MNKLLIVDGKPYNGNIPLFAKYKLRDSSTSLSLHFKSISFTKSSIIYTNTSF